jgi:hypothetical protein
VDALCGRRRGASSQTQGALTVLGIVQSSVPFMSPGNVSAHSVESPVDVGATELQATRESRAMQVQRPGGLNKLSMIDV